MKKKDTKSRPAHNIERIYRMDLPSLLNWMDTSIMTMGNSFDKWRYQNGDAEEVTQHIQVISALWDEIQNRKS